MKFGAIKRLTLLGGGRLLFECALLAKRANFAVLVVTSPRHAQQRMADGEDAFIDVLARAGIKAHISKDISRDAGVSEWVTSDTLALSFGAAWIFRKEFIDQFSGRLLNCHGARLPQNRGAANFSWQILRGNRLGYCLIHQVDEGIDTGSVLKVREFLYPSWCRIPIDFHQVYVTKNLEMLEEFLGEIAQERDFVVFSQPEYLSSYWPRLSTEHHAFIDWHWTLIQIERFICAFDKPYEGASTFVGGKRVYLRSCFADFNDGGFHPFQAGLIYRKGPETLFVATEQGTLVVGEARDKDGRSLMKDFRLGDRFITSREYLEKASAFRAVYTPDGLKS